MTVYRKKPAKPPKPEQPKPDEAKPEDAAPEQPLAKGCLVLVWLMFLIPFVLLLRLIIGFFKPFWQAKPEFVTILFWLAAPIAIGIYVYMRLLKSGTEP